MTTATLATGARAPRRFALLRTLLLLSLGSLVLLSVLLIQGLASLPLDVQINGQGLDGWLDLADGASTWAGGARHLAAGLATGALVLLLVLLPLALVGGLLSIGLGLLLVLGLAIGLPLLLVGLALALPLGLLLLPVLLLWWLLR